MGTYPLGPNCRWEVDCLMAKAKTKQGAALDRAKFFGDPVMVTTIVVLIALLVLFILYPLAILLVDSVITDKGLSLEVFQRILICRLSIKQSQIR